MKKDLSNAELLTCLKTVVESKKQTNEPLEVVWEKATSEGMIKRGNIVIVEGLNNEGYTYRLFDFFRGELDE